MRLTLSIVSGQVSGVQRGLSHTFGREGGIIGRNAACDWQIEDATRTVSGRHATISFRDGRFYVTDTSTNGLYIDGSVEPLGRGRSAEISEGTRLRFGDYVVAAALSDMMPSDEDRALPRMSIAPNAAPRGLSTDPLDLLGDTFGSEELSMAPQRREPPKARQSSPRTTGTRARAKDDTLGSFFGSSGANRKGDPFADLGSADAADAGEHGSAPVGEDWMGSSASAPSDARTYVPPMPEPQSQTVRAPVQPARPVQAPATEVPKSATADIGSALSHALASELDDAGSEPSRRSVRHRVPAPTESAETDLPATPEQAEPAASSEAALPHDLSWEDLLGADAAPPPGPRVAPASTPASGAAPTAQPLPSIDELLGGIAAPAGGPAAKPSADAAPAGTRQARRPRREPGNNLLSDLVTPATRSDASRKAAANPLDPVSVLSQRASHRPAMTHYTAEAPAAAPAPASPAAAPEGAGAAPAAFDAVLRAAGLDPAIVPAEKRAEAACELARAARAAAIGMTDVLAARRLFKEEFRLDRTRVQPEHNNPFKFQKSGDEALTKAIGGREEGFLAADEAMTEGFLDVKAHELAAMAALQNVIATLLAQLDPASIQAEDAAGGFFGRGDGKALWERYKELHASLAQDPEATARSLVSDQFRKAYDKTIATMRAKDPSR